LLGRSPCLSEVWAPDARILLFERSVYREAKNIKK